MHSLEGFSKLYQEEASLQSTIGGHSKFTAEDIRAGFLDIVSISKVPLENISFAHLAGSYSRKEQTA